MSIRYVLCFLLCFSGCERETNGPREASNTTSNGSLRLSNILFNNASQDTQGKKQSAATFEKAEQIRTFIFPDDHGSHEGFRSEWWYWVMHLSDASGREFGVQFTVFRQALSAVKTKAQTKSQTKERTKRWSDNQIYMAHLAISDVQNQLHRSYERISRRHPDLAGVGLAPFVLKVDGWQVASAKPLSAQSIFPLQFDLIEVNREERNAVQLVIEQGPGVVLQGESGLSRKAENSASYYYSMPRLPVSGFLVLNGRTYQVTGLAWLDREWSSGMLQSAHTGWNWFALHLYSGENIMLFNLRRHDGLADTYNAGSVNQGAGKNTSNRTRILQAKDFHLRVNRYWQDENGVYWPVDWHLELLEGAEQYHIVAVFDKQLMHTSLSYWEGMVDVYQIKESGEIKVGRGYMEHTGYNEYKEAFAN